MVVTVEGDRVENANTETDLLRGGKDTAKVAVVDVVGVTKARPAAGHGRGARAAGRGRGSDARENENGPRAGAVVRLHQGPLRKAAHPRGNGTGSWRRVAEVVAVAAVAAATNHWGRRLLC